MYGRRLHGDWQEYLSKEAIKVINGFAKSMSISSKRPKPKDEVQITNGSYIGVKGIVLEPDYTSLKENMILVKTDKLNKLYVDPI